MVDEDWKAIARRRICQSIEHLSNSGKLDRETWVARKLVGALGVQFSEDEVRKAEEPADVAFRDARFQIKEILDPHRKRVDEYRAELSRLDHATEPSDMYTQYEPSDLTMFAAAAIASERAAELVGKYGRVERRGLDLVFYVNFLGVSVVDDGTPIRIIESPGFRSISLLADGLVAVAWADESAPLFIRSNVGAVQSCKAN